MIYVLLAVIIVLEIFIFAFVYCIDDEIFNRCTMFSERITRTQKLLIDLERETTKVAQSQRQQIDNLVIRNAELEKHWLKEIRELKKEVSNINNKNCEIFEPIEPYKFTREDLKRVHLVPNTVLESIFNSSKEEAKK